MNYLTMCRPTPNQITSSNIIPTPGTSRTENNIYSIPLFHNEFYENIETVRRSSCDITQACRHHICDATSGTDGQLPFRNLRYTPETWRTNVQDSNGSLTNRESGTESLHINCRCIHRPRPDTNEINHDSVTEILKPKELNKHNSRLICKMVICLCIGIIFGIITSSVVWLTVDRFKHTDLNCLVQSSLTINKKIKNSSDFDDIDKNEIYDLSEQSVVQNFQTSTSFPRDSNTQIQQENDKINSTPAELFPTIPTKQTTGTTGNAVEDGLKTDVLPTSQSINDLVNTPTFSVQSTDSPPVYSSKLSTTADVTMSTSPELTSVMHSKRPSTPHQTSPTPLFTPDFTTEDQVSSSVGTDQGDYSLFAEGLSQTTEDSIIASVGGHVYYRWGRLDCPDYSELVYTGFVAGGHYIHSGGAANNLCLPSNPTWANYNDAIEPDRNLIHVTEYESTDSSFNTMMGKHLHDQNVPCAVCQATGRYSYLMIPGRTECIHGWYQEYTGYLMGGSFEHPHGKSVICVDEDPQTVGGRQANENGNLLYFVEFRGTNTEHYINGRELPCVVCTR